MVCPRRNGHVQQRSNLPLDHLTEDIKNCFLLRHDLHHAFNSRLFCLAVKEGKIVVHFLRRTYEVGACYHNLEFRLPAGEPALEFIWARFAWSVFPLITKFASTQNCLVRLADGATRRTGTKRPAVVPSPGDTSTTTSTSTTATVLNVGSMGFTRPHKRKMDRPNTDCPDTIFSCSATIEPAISGRTDGRSPLDHDPGIPAARNSPGEDHQSPTRPSTSLTSNHTYDLGVMLPTPMSHQERERDCQKQQPFFPLMSMLYLSCSSGSELSIMPADNRS